MHMDKGIQMEPNALGVFCEVQSLSETGIEFGYVRNNCNCKELFCGLLLK